MSKEAMKLALEAAYLAGWNASGEGYNSEYPFGDHARNPEEDAAWIKDRDNALRKALAEQPAPMIRGDIRDGLVDDEPAQPAQPSKPWVGLTDEDIKEAEWLLSAIKEHEAYTLQEQLLVEGVDVFARAIEAKLREKNA